MSGSSVIYMLFACLKQTALSCNYFRGGCNYSVTAREDKCVYRTQFICKWNFKSFTLKDMTNVIMHKQSKKWGVLSRREATAGQKESEECSCSELSLDWHWLACLVNCSMCKL